MVRTCGSRTSLMLLQQVPMLLIRPSHPQKVTRLQLKTRLRMQHKIRPPNQMKQLETRQLLKAIKLSKTKLHQQLMRLLLQTKLS